jgi:2-methylcitrate dehydratase PrpD
MTATGVVAALAELGVDLHARPLPADVSDAARAAVLDWVGVTLGGSTQPVVAALLDGLGPGTGPCRVIGRPDRVPVAVAALVNGSAAHVLELDDIYSAGLFHPGAPVIAAALAVAEQRGCTFGDLLRAVVVGYEIGCRVATDLGPAHYAHWHTTGTAGAVAAAAAAADLRGLEGPAFAHALALAATTAGGLQQTFRSDAAGKPLHAGAAAQAGVVAAAAAAGGITGAADVLEGPAGLAVATGTSTDWSASRAPAQRPLAIEEVTVKPYPCCGHAFAAIDGALELRSDGVDPARITAVTVATYATALATAGIAAPRTDAERRFSIGHLVASALVLGAHEMFGPAAASDSGVASLTPLVRLEVEDAYEDRFPAHRGARVRLEFTDGSPVTADVPDRSGSPERPLDARRRAEKFAATAAPVLGRTASARYDELVTLDPSTPVREVPFSAG